MMSAKLWLGFRNVGRYGMAMPGRQRYNNIEPEKYCHLYD